MANKSSDALWQLVHSMTKTEKRYFMLHFTRVRNRENAAMTKLFNVLSAQKQHDDKAAARRCGVKTDTNSYSLMKNRLYQAIMRSLENYHSAQAPAAQLTRMIHGAELLVHKMLYDQAAKMLRQAVKLAREHELISYLPALYRAQRLLLERTDLGTQGNAELSSHLNSSEQTLELLHTEHTLWKLKSELLAKLYSGEQPDERAIKHTDEKITAIEKTIANHRSLQLQTGYLRSLWYFVQNRYSECLDYLQQNLNLLDAEQTSRADLDAYVSTLTNAIATASYTGRFEDAATWLQRLETISPHSDEGGMEYYYLKARSVKLNYLIQLEKFEEASALITPLAEVLERTGQRLSALRHAQYYFNFAIVLMNLQQYRDALRWCNMLINQTQPEHQEIMRLSMLFRLVIYAELGKIDLLPVAMRPVGKNLKEPGAMSKIENTLLQYLKSLSKKRKTSDAMDSLKELATQLESLYAAYPTDAMIHRFHFGRWAQRKLQTEALAGNGLYNHDLNQ